MSRSSFAWPPRTVLVAVDTEPAAVSLVDRATTLALLLGARLVVVHAVCVGANDVPTEVTGLIEVLENLDVSAHAHVAELVRRAASFGVATSSVVMHGEPLRILTEAVRSERAELVVMGARHRSRISRALLGDLSTELLALGTCGVLVLPIS